MGALLGVIVFDILPGVVIGVALSFALLIRRLDHPYVALLGRSRDGTRFEDLTAHEDATAVPGALIYRFESPLVFANAEIFSDGVLGAVAEADPAPEAVILDFESVPDIDSTGDDALVELQGTLQDQHIRLLVVRAMSDVRELMSRDGAMDAIGADNVYPTVREAVTSLS